MNDELATKRDLEQAVAMTKRDVEQAVAMTKRDIEQAVAMTKRDLDQAVTTLRAEMATKRDLEQVVTMLRGEMGELRTELRGEMTDLRKEMIAMKTELVREFAVEGARIANTMVEQLRAQVNVVEEKYQDLPPAHAKLREDFDAHAADARIHARAPSPVPRRARRPRSS